MLSDLYVHIENAACRLLLVVSIPEMAGFIFRLMCIKFFFQIRVPPPSPLHDFSRKACRSEADCSLLVCSPQAQVLVSAGFRRTFSTICHGCLSPCCAGTWHTHTHTHTLARSNTERCAADSVVMMECKGLGNSLAPGGISSLPNEMGMESVGPSRISAGRHVALERPASTPQPIH